jgi:stage II sporulation protein D
MRRRVFVALVVAGCLCYPAAALAGSLFLIKGAGWGNGVGMSQWGAEGYAVHGWDYRRILAHYYPHTTLGTAADPSVRVLLAEKKTTVAIGSSAPFLLVDARGRKVHVPARTLRFGARMRMGGKPLVPPVTVKPGVQPLSLDGAAFRGTMTIVRGAGALSVVNTVPLELYLRAVVPSEMPRGWLLPAYEAQAVAARSYVLTRLDPGAPFDVYRDGRNQVYAGVAAETNVTNDAVGRTTGQVLTYDGRVVTAYYDSDAGGRTAAVEDVYTGRSPEPYLVSVSDPYDSLSPYRHWRLALTAQGLSSRLRSAIEDVRVTHAPSGVATTVELRGQHGRTLMAATDFQRRLGLRSPRFSISVVALTGASQPHGSRGPLQLHGFVRGIGGVVLQARLRNGGWRQVAHVHARANGRFVVTVRSRSATAYRVAVERVAGPPLEVGGRGR